MNVVNQKYNNFLKFILEIDETNEWILWIQNIDMTSFLITIKTKNHLEIDDIYNEIVATTKLHEDKLINHSVKLKKYIMDFKEITNII